MLKSMSRLAFSLSRPFQYTEGDEWLHARRDIECAARSLHEAEDAEKAAAAVLAQVKLNVERLAKRKELLERNFFAALRASAPARAGRQPPNNHPCGGSVDGENSSATVGTTRSVGIETRGGTVEAVDAIDRYRRMLSMGVPAQAVAQKMKKDGLDPSRLFVGLEAPREAPELSSRARVKARNGNGTASAMRRKLYWEPIAPERLHAAGTIWTTTSKSMRDFFGGAGEAVVLHDFDALFVAGATLGQRASSASTAKTKRRTLATAILDPRRALAGSVALARLRGRSPDAIGAAVRGTDAIISLSQPSSGLSSSSAVLSPGGSSVAGPVSPERSERAASSLDSDELEALAILVPSRAERRALVRAVASTKARLSPLEEVMCVLGRVPHCAVRIEAMRFVFTLEEATARLRAGAATIIAACEAVQASAGLRRAFHIILLLGNRLNSGAGAHHNAASAGSSSMPSEGATKGSSVLLDATGSEATKAFKVRSLLALASTKGFDGHTTVLEYLVRVLERIDHQKNVSPGTDIGGCASFENVLRAPVAAASRVQLEVADFELERLDNDRARLAAAVQAAIDGGGADYGTEEASVANSCVSAEFHATAPSPSSVADFIRQRHSAAAAMTGGFAPDGSQGAPFLSEIRSAASRRQPVKAVPLSSTFGSGGGKAIGLESDRDLVGDIGIRRGDNDKRGDSDVDGDGDGNGGGDGDRSGSGVWCAAGSGAVVVEGDAGLQALAACLTSAEREVAATRSCQKGSQIAVERLRGFFCEDAALGASDLFATLHSFLEAVATARVAQGRKRAQEARLAARRLQPAEGCMPVVGCRHKT